MDAQRWRWTYSAGGWSRVRGHQVRGVMPDIKAPPTRHKNEMPLLDAIVRFP